MDAVAVVNGCSGTGSPVHPFHGSLFTITASIKSGQHLSACIPWTILPPNCLGDEDKAAVEPRPRQLPPTTTASTYLPIKPAAAAEAAGLWIWT